MPYDPDLHHRQSLRLQSFDYTAAAVYFLTICTHGRRCIFGDVEEGEMRLGAAGAVAAEEWTRSAGIRPYVTLDAFVVMPNHVHGVVVTNTTSQPPGRTANHTPQRATSSLGSFVAGYKSAVTARIKTLPDAPSGPVWQRNYYEHIIRKTEDLDRVRDYIANNPARWDLDRENPTRG